MLVILPPSETKTDDGSGEPLDFSALGFARLTGRRKTLVSAVRRLAKDADAMMAALKIGPKLRGEVDRNRALLTSPTTPAIERYTGVLFDGLDVASFTPAQYEFAADHIAIHSALFGLLGASDAIPAYRLSHDSRVPQHPLKKHWGEGIATCLREHDGLILDLRSEAYVGLGPAPQHDDSYFIRVVTQSGDGQKRALNHFNKKGKGEFVRTLVESGRVFTTVDQLLVWADQNGVRLRPGAPGELELVVEQVVGRAA